MSIEKEFYEKLRKTMINDREIHIHEIYTMFPDVNQRTITWRLHNLVEKGDLNRVKRGVYTLGDISGHKSAGYEYLLKRSKTLYDKLIEYGYDFYITGLDAISGELLHMPENYPTLIAGKSEFLAEIADEIRSLNYFVVTEKDTKVLKMEQLRNNIDVLLIQADDLTLAKDSIALKEKGFVDLYYAVTRLDYGFPIQELVRVFNNMKRNRSIARVVIRKSAKEHKISSEIEWLLDLDKYSAPALTFMMHELREVVDEAYR